MILLKIKQKQKLITKPTKKKIQKRLREYYRNIPEEKKILKRNYDNDRNKKYVACRHKKKKTIYKKVL